MHKPLFSLNQNIIPECPVCKKDFKRFKTKRGRRIVHCEKCNYWSASPLIERLESYIGKGCSNV